MLHVAPIIASVSAVAVFLTASPAFCQSATAPPQIATTAPKALPVFDFPQSDATFSTGDTWASNGQTFRLYGVQSCVRGTYFTNAAGARTDCGEASLAYTAAIVRDSKPRCTAVTQAGLPPVTYTVCAAHIGGSTLDLGTILITQGFAFAATDANGKPVTFAYSVAESEAAKAKRGIWSAPDLPHPAKTLLNTAHHANNNNRP